MKLTQAQDEKMRKEDSDADQAALSTKIKFKVDEVRAELLKEKTIKAEELRVQREKRREEDKIERNKAEKVIYKEILRKEKEAALEAERLEKEAVKTGFGNRLGNMTSFLKGSSSLKNLPGIKGEGSRSSTLLKKLPFGGSFRVGGSSFRLAGAGGADDKGAAKPENAAGTLSGPLPSLGETAAGELDNDTRQNPLDLLGPAKPNPLDGMKALDLKAVAGGGTSVKKK